MDVSQGDKAFEGERTHARRNDTPERLAVNIKTACRMLDVSRSSIYRALDTGELEGTVVCGRRLIIVASLREALKRGAKR